MAEKKGSKKSKEAVVVKLPKEEKITTRLEEAVAREKALEIKTETELKSEDVIAAEKLGEEILNPFPKIDSEQTDEDVEKTVLVKEELVKAKFIMVGMTEVTDKGKEIVAQIKAAEEYTVIELTIDEMNAVVNDRIGKDRSNTAEEIMDSPENKARAASLAMQLIERFKGDEFVLIGEIKRATNFSWSKFNNIIGTLDIFGHVQWQDDKRKALRIIVDKDTMMNNLKSDIQKTMDFLKGQLIQLETDYSGGVDVKQITKLKTSLKIK